MRGDASSPTQATKHEVEDPPYRRVPRKFAVPDSREGDESHRNAGALSDSTRTLAAEGAEGAISRRKRLECLTERERECCVLSVPNRRAAS